MVRRVAAVMALIVFAVCLLVGMFEADNSFATTVGRALKAMAFSLVIGLVVGAMAKAMINENLKSEEKSKNVSASTPPNDR